MKSIIVNPFTPIPKSDKSHVRGWSMLWANRLGAEIGTKEVDVRNYDTIYIDHGVNFSGSLNLFGGFNDEVANRVIQLIEAIQNGSEVISLDWSMEECNYVDQIQKRIGSKTTSDLVDFDFLDNLYNYTRGIFTRTWGSIPSDNIILGDSHSLAFMDSNQIIKRINGQLLYSALNKGLSNFILEHLTDFYDHDISDIKTVRLCLGSIDIRHHVLKDGRMSADEFAKVYACQIIEAQNKLGIKIQACIPVPIEHEGRKIPGTGQYEGRNFLGSRQERLDYTLEFIQSLSDEAVFDFDIVYAPKPWYEMDGEIYAKEIMELASSVHIAPRNYKSILGW